MNKSTSFFDKIDLFYKSAQDSRIANSRIIFDYIKNQAQELKREPLSKQWFSDNDDELKFSSILFRGLDPIINASTGSVFQDQPSDKMKEFEDNFVKRFYQAKNDYVKSNISPADKRALDAYEQKINEFKNNFYHIRQALYGKDVSWLINKIEGKKENGSEPVPPPVEGPSEVSNQDDPAVSSPDVATDSPKKEKDQDKKPVRKGYGKISEDNQKLLNWYLSQKMGKDPNSLLIIDEVFGPKTLSAINEIKRHLNFEKSNSELFRHLQSLKGDSKSDWSVPQQSQDVKNFQENFSDTISYLQGMKDLLTEMYQTYNKIFSTSSIYTSQSSILQSTPSSKEDLTKHLRVVDSIFSDFKKIIGDKVRSKEVTQTEVNEISPLFGNIKRTRDGLGQALNALVNKGVLNANSPRAASYLNNKFVSLSSEMDYFKKSLAQENVTPGGIVSQPPQSGRADTSGQISFLQPQEVANQPQVSVEVKKRMDNLIQDPLVRKFFHLNFNSLKNSQGQFDNSLDKKTFQVMSAMKRFYKISLDQDLFDKIFEIDKINLPKIDIKSQQLIKEYISKYNITTKDFELDGLITGPFKKALNDAKQHYMTKLKITSLTDKDFINKMKQESEFGQMHEQTEKDLYPGGAPKITNELINKKIISLANDLKNIKM